jgi:hypothetical protein
MNKLHITQDDHGYWMLSLEQGDGTMTLLAHQFPSPAHLIENANEMVAEGQIDAVILVDPPRARVAAAFEGIESDYRTPAPRKAGE